MKTYEYKTNYKTYQVNIELDTYSFDGSLAIQLVEAETGFPITTLTVCLDDDLGLPYFCVGKDTNFVDTNNNPEAEEFIKKYELGEPTGFKARSGYCEYPCYKFDLKKLAE